VNAVSAPVAVFNILGNLLDMQYPDHNDQFADLCVLYREAIL